jgi:glutamine synthetase
MLHQHIIPAVKSAGVGPLSDLQHHAAHLQAEIAKLHALAEKGVSLYERAKKARVLRMETMITIRETVDAAEAVVPANLWTLATYTDLLFLDQTLP